MDQLGQITWVDVLVVLVLAVGALLGWTQGFMRYVACSAGVLVAFVVAAQLKHSTAELLTFWTAFTPAVRELLIFVVLFLLLVIGIWFGLRAVAGGLRLPVPRIADELGGAVMGIFFAALVLFLVIVALASYYTQPTEPGVAGSNELAQARVVRSAYETLTDSAFATFLRNALTPTAGLLVRPFVPDDVRAVL
ncbi:MAG: CvpA family protein [Chloroflexota bacterium]|nr:CvpA family protein [Chloroflexota bacterium]